MSQMNAPVNNVVPFKTSVSKPQTEPTLKDILKNKDVRDFFKFVHENDLRMAALEAIKMKLEQNN